MITRRSMAASTCPTSTETPRVTFFPPTRFAHPSVMPPDMPATPFVLVAARLAMTATTSSAICMVPCEPFSVMPQAPSTRIPGSFSSSERFYHTSVDQKCRSGDIGVGFGRQEGHNPGEFLRTTVTAQRDRRLEGTAHLLHRDPFHARLGLIQFPHPVGVDPSGADRVDQDAPGTQFF